MPQLQILPQNPSFGSQLGQGLGEGAAQGIAQRLDAHIKNQQQQSQGKALADGIGKPELAGLFAKVGPDISKILLQNFGAENLSENLAKISGINNSGRSAPSTSPSDTQEQTPRQGSPSSKEEFMEIYRKSAPKEKEALLKQYNKEREIQDSQKRSGLKDTSKIREEIANKGQSAEKAIRSKEKLIKLIDKGDISSPHLAQLGKYLPESLRNSLLSTDSLVYEAGLFDEFGVLKDMFPGQIRTKELDLLEPKLASLYKNDEAKKEILKSGIKSAHADIIRAKAAAEIEKSNPELSRLEFQRAVEERSAPELQKLYDEIEGDLTRIANKYAPESKKNIENKAKKDEGSVFMIDPSGQLRKVDKGDIQKAQSAGYRVKE